MRLYGNGTLLNGIALWVQLEKSRTEAASTLTAALLSGAGDTYLQKAALSTGDTVRLLDDGGREVFLGAVQALRREPERTVLTACDQGLYLTQNQLAGIFAGTPGEVCRAVAQALGLPVGALAAPEGYVCAIARSGRSAYSILRQAVGPERDIGVQAGRLTVSDPAAMAYGLPPERVLALSAQADVYAMVNRCLVVDSRGVQAARAENAAAQRSYGLRQQVLSKSGDAAAQARRALTGRQMGGQAKVWGNLNYSCAASVTLRFPAWGFSGTYPITAAVHRWEAGLFTTALTWKGVEA